MLKNKIHIGVFTPKWGKVKLKRHSHILVLLTLVFNPKCQLHLIFHKRITHSFSVQITCISNGAHFYSTIVVIHHHDFSCESAKLP